jgi:hypothetical protein
MNTHREYQKSCFKYLTEMENSIKSQMKAIEQEIDETSKACFSMLDDLIAYDSKGMEDFQRLSKEGNARWEVTAETLQAFMKLMHAKEKLVCKQRHSLFELESKKILLDFSFSKQSKFVELYRLLTQGKRHLLRHLLRPERLPLPDPLRRFERVLA